MKFSNILLIAVLVLSTCTPILAKPANEQYDEVAEQARLQGIANANQPERIRLIKNFTYLQEYVDKVFAAYSDGVINQDRGADFIEASIKKFNREYPNKTVLIKGSWSKGFSILVE